MLDLNLIDPENFAAQKLHWQGELLLSELDARVRSHEYLANQDAGLAVSLQGGRDRWQRLFLDLSVEGSLPLVCQRCMQPVAFELDEKAHIVLFANEQALDEAMLSDEELDGMLLVAELDVRELVEDQILMALPYSPRHDDCENQALEQTRRDKPSPFAVLAGLKGSK